MLTISEMALVMPMNDLAFFRLVQLIVVAAILIFRLGLLRPKRDEVVDKWERGYNTVCTPCIYGVRLEAIAYSFSNFMRPTAGSSFWDNGYWLLWGDSLRMRVHSLMSDNAVILSCRQWMRNDLLRSRRDLPSDGWFYESLKGIFTILWVDGMFAGLQCFELINIIN